MSTAYIQQQPDWGTPVVAVMKWRTDLTQSFDNTEQRARRMIAPKWSINYAVNGLSVAQWSVRRAALMGEAGNLVAMPLWPFPEVFSTDSATQVTLGRVTATLAFKKGGLAYFYEAGLDATFRQIDDVGVDTLTLATGAIYPAVSIPSYTAAAVVYPCIYGFRGEAAQASFERHNSTMEIIAVEEV